MKVKKVNIYLDNEMREKTKELSRKYHVSLSTIVQTIADSMVLIMKRIYDEKLINLADTKKTSIKPKLLYTEDVINSIDKKAKNYLLSATLYIYCHDKIYDYYTKDEGMKVKQKIHNELYLKKESFYNYNEQFRNNVRMMKDESFRNYMRKYDKNDRKPTQTSN